jgi:hypothetical protein
MLTRMLASLGFKKKTAPLDLPEPFECAPKISPTNYFRTQTAAPIRLCEEKKEASITDYTTEVERLI